MIPSVSVRLLLTQSDERLVGYARAGHERAFEALVQRHRRQLLGYCRRLLLSEQSAEDALQQALLQAWMALRDGAEVRDARSWLFRIVHNAAVNTLRVSRYDYTQLSESLCGADAPQADLDRRIAVREALAGLAALPPMQREALLRTAVEGHSHQRAATDLGVSEPALRGLVYRARASLRAAAGAIVPPPLLGWALEASGRGTSALERLAGLGAGGGSAGLAGLLVKGGVVAVTAGALAGGIVATHERHAHQARHHLVLAGSALTSSGDAGASRGLRTVSTAHTVAFARPSTGRAGHPWPATASSPSWARHHRRQRNPNIATRTPAAGSRRPPSTRWAPVPVADWTPGQSGDGHAHDGQASPERRDGNGSGSVRSENSDTSGSPSGQRANERRPGSAAGDGSATGSRGSESERNAGERHQSSNRSRDSEGGFGQGDSNAEPGPGGGKPNDGGRTRTGRGHDSSVDSGGTAGASGSRAMKPGTDGWRESQSSSSARSGAQGPDTGGNYCDGQPAGGPCCPADCPARGGSSPRNASRSSFTRCGASCCTQ